MREIDDGLTDRKKDSRQGKVKRGSGQTMMRKYNSVEARIRLWMRIAAGSDKQAPGAGRAFQFPQPRYQQS